MPSKSHEDSVGRIEPISSELKATLAEVGRSILSITQGEEAISALRTSMAPARRFLDGYRYRDESIRPEPGKLFILVFNRPLPVSIYFSKQVGSGCSSGMSSDTYEIVAETGNVFIADSLTPFAHDYHRTFLSGYQFNSPGHSAPSL